MTGRYGIWSPGPPEKVWADANIHDGIILHSMEGSLPVALGMLNDVSALADGSWRNPVSWHFSIGLDGRVLQHYDLTQSPWHAGSRTTNRRFIGIEHEGVKGQLVTGVQLGASVGLVKALAAEFGWKEARRGLGLFEHNEWSQTTCPNGRIPWGNYVVTVVPPPQQPSLRDQLLASVDALRTLVERMPK